MTESEQTKTMPTDTPSEEANMVVTGTSGKSYYLSDGLGGIGKNLSTFKSVLSLEKLITDITFVSYLYRATLGYRLDPYVIQEINDSLAKLAEKIILLDYGFFNSTTNTAVIDPELAFGINKYYASGMDLSAEKTKYTYSTARANNYRNQLLDSIQRTVAASNASNIIIDALDPIVEPRNYLKNRIDSIVTTGTQFELDIIDTFYKFNVFMANDLRTIDDLRVLASKFNTLTTSGSIHLHAPSVDTRSTYAMIPACRGFASKFFSANLVRCLDNIGHNLVGAFVNPIQPLDPNQQDVRFAPGDNRIRRIHLDMCIAKAEKVQKSLGTNASLEYAVKLGLDKSKLTASSAAINATSEASGRAMIHSMFAIMFSGGSHFLTCDFVPKGQVVTIIEAICRKAIIPDHLLTDDDIANIDNTILVGFVPILLKTLTPGGGQNPNANADRQAIDNMISYINSLDPASYQGDNYMTDILLNLLPGQVNARRNLVKPLGPAPRQVRVSKPLGNTGNLLFVLEKPRPIGLGPQGARDFLNFILSDRRNGAGWCSAYAEKVRLEPDKDASSTCRAVPNTISRQNFNFQGEYDLIDLMATSTNSINTIAKNCYEYNPSGVANQFIAVNPGPPLLGVLPIHVIGAPIPVTNGINANVININSPLVGNHQESAFRAFVSLIQAITVIPKAKGERDIFNGVQVLVQTLFERYSNNFDQFTLAFNNILYYHGMGASTNIGMSRSLIASHLARGWFINQKLDGLTIPDTGATSLIQLLSADVLAGIFTEPSFSEIFTDEWNLSQSLCDLCALNVIPTCSMFPPSVVGAVIPNNNNLALGAPPVPVGLQHTIQNIFNINSYENVKFTKRARFIETFRLYNKYGYKHDFIKTVERLLSGNGEHSYYDLILPVPSMPLNRAPPVGFTNNEILQYNNSIIAPPPAILPPPNAFMIHTGERVHNRILIKLAIARNVINVHFADNMSFGICKSGFSLSLTRRTRLRNNAAINPAFVINPINPGVAPPLPDIFKLTIANRPAPFGAIQGVGFVPYTYSGLVNDYRTSNGNVNEFRRKMNLNELNDRSVMFHIHIPYKVKKVTVSEYYSNPDVHNNPLDWKQDPFVNLSNQLMLKDITIPVVMNVENDTLQNTTSIILTESDYLITGQLNYGGFPVSVRAQRVKKEEGVVKFVTIDDWVTNTTLNYKK